MASDHIMALIAAERARQDARADGGIGKYAADGRTLLALAVLTEEVGEVAKAALNLTIPDNGTTYLLRYELVQVAAVAIGWLDGMEATDG